MKLFDVKIDFNKKYEPIDVLDEREKRVQRQEELRSKHDGTMIVVRVNYPGTNKVNKTTVGICREVGEKMLGCLEQDIICSECNVNAEGPVLMMLVRRNPTDAKKIAMNVEENSPLGRYVDIDVYGMDGRSISRTELGFEPRKCYLCGDVAHNCVRSRKHDIEEIIQHIENACRHVIKE